MRRVVCHLDLWGVLRFALALYATFLAVTMAAGVGLWLVGGATGARHRIETFVASTFLLKNFRLEPLAIFLVAGAVGVVLVALATAITVLLAAFFNLVSDAVGGIEVTMIEEEPRQQVV